MISIDLSGKTAVITGSARGIGRAIAEKLAEAGANIIISDIMAEVGEVTAKEIADKIDFYGAHIEIEAEKDISIIHLICLSKYLKEVLGKQVNQDLEKGSRFLQSYIS